MAQTLLDQLSQMTVVVADTGDINAIRKFKPRDATTNPSLIMAAAQMKEYAQVVDDALGFARKEAGAGAGKDAIVKKAIDRLSEYQYMADFGTCAIGWPLQDEWEADIISGRMPVRK